MVNRFSRTAREAVRRARDQARDLGHPVITTGHLLLALCDGETAGVLQARGVTAEAVRSELADLASSDPRPAPSDPRPARDDAGHLAALGIDVEQIRAAIERQFGPGALERPLVRADTRTQRWWGRLAAVASRGRTTEVGTDDDELAALAGTASGRQPPFSDPLKGALELSLREAVELRDSHIGPEHLLLGLMRCHEGVAALVMDRLDVSRTSICADIIGRRLRSA